MAGTAPSGFGILALGLAAAAVPVAASAEDDELVAVAEAASFSAAATVQPLPLSASRPEAAASQQAVSPVSPVSPASPVSAVSLAQPVGSVRIARVGDKLGSVRRSRRTTSNGIVTVDFSPARRSSGRRYAGVSLPSGMPLDRARLTSGFGYRYHPVTGGYRHHSGIDLAAPRGTPIRATSDGVVLSSGWAGGYGIVVRLDHGAGTESRYAHMSRVAVGAGQDVKRGQVIGYVGSTGRSTGPHLHYEIRKGGRAVNPMP